MGVITNKGYEATAAARPPPERDWVHQPDAASSYSHHPFLTCFNGRYYLIWASGRKQEDAPRERVLLSTSSHRRPDLPGRLGTRPLDPTEHARQAGGRRRDHLALKTKFDLPAPALCEGLSTRTDECATHMQLLANSDRLCRTEGDPYRQRMEGMHKGGSYGYPGTLIHDGHLRVARSRMKEAVEVLRTQIP